MSKEKQIEEMARYCHFYEEGKCLLLEDEKVECDMNCDMCRLAKALYNAGYRKQEWISVEERLPYAGEDVLVLCDGLICIDFICSSGVWYEHALKQVTHWMPLPKAPNMQREVRV